jgi:Tol biopolymer transport system component
MKQTILLLLAAAVLAACGDDSPTSNDPAPHHTIIYTASNISDGQMEIVRSLSDGSNRTVLFRGSLMSAPVAGHILYLGADRTDLLMANLDGSGARSIRSAGYPTQIQHAVLSPDGEHFASVDWNSSRPELAVQRLDGTERNVIAIDLWSDTKASFSPDGRKLAFFASDRSVRVIDIEGTNQTAVTAPSQGTLRNDAELSWMPAWSPSGEWLAVESLSSEMIDIVRADGGTTPVIPSFRGSYPVWSPDGKEISCNDNEWIVVHPINGTSRGVYTDWSFGNRTYHPWSPDGRRLLSRYGNIQYSGQLMSIDIARHEMTVIDPNAFDAYWVP